MKAIEGANYAAQPDGHGADRLIDGNRSATADDRARGGAARSVRSSKGIILTAVRLSTARKSPDLVEAVTS